MESLAKFLELGGWGVWWDQSIQTGKRYDRIIEAELESAKCILVVWTKESVNSDWVRSEAEEGMERGILIPVMMEDVKIPLAFRRMQAAILTDWTGTGLHSELEKILEDISEMVPPKRDLPIEILAVALAPEGEFFQKPLYPCCGLW